MINTVISILTMLTLILAVAVTYCGINGILISRSIKAGGGSVDRYDDVEDWFWTLNGVVIVLLSIAEQYFNIAGKNWPPIWLPIVMSAAGIIAFIVYVRKYINSDDEPRAEKRRLKFIIAMAFCITASHLLVPFFAWSPDSSEPKQDAGKGAAEVKAAEVDMKELTDKVDQAMATDGSLADKADAEAGRKAVERAAGKMADLDVSELLDTKYKKYLHMKVSTDSMPGKDATRLQEAREVDGQTSKDEKWPLEFQFTDPRNKEKVKEELITDWFENPVAGTNALRFYADEYPVLLKNFDFLQEFKELDISLFNEKRDRSTCQLSEKGEILGVDYFTEVNSKDETVTTTEYCEYIAELAEMVFETGLFEYAGVEQRTSTVQYILPMQYEDDEEARLVLAPDAKPSDTINGNWRHTKRRTEAKYQDNFLNVMYRATFSEASEYGVGTSDKNCKLVEGAKAVAAMGNNGPIEYGIGISDKNYKLFYGNPEPAVPDGGTPPDKDKETPPSEKPKDEPGDTPGTTHSKTPDPEDPVKPKPDDPVTLNPDTKQNGQGKIPDQQDNADVGGGDEPADLPHGDTEAPNYEDVEQDQSQDSQNDGNQNQNQGSTSSPGGSDNNTSTPSEDVETSGNTGNPNVNDPIIVDPNGGVTFDGSPMDDSEIDTVAPMDAEESSSKSNSSSSGSVTVDNSSSSQSGNSDANNKSSGATTENITEKKAAPPIED